MTTRVIKVDSFFNVINAGTNCMYTIDVLYNIITSINLLRCIQQNFT